MTAPALRPYEKLCDACGKTFNKFATRCQHCPSGVTTLYRYVDKLSEDVPHIYLRTFTVKRETKAVWFVVDDYRERRVYKDSRVSYAYPTIELARESFTIRKQKQMGYLRRQWDHVEAINARLKAGTAWDELKTDDPLFFELPETP